MEVQLRHQPSFSVARVLLGPNEPLRAEAGAMMAMAADTPIEVGEQQISATVTVRFALGTGIFGLALFAFRCLEAMVAMVRGERELIIASHEAEDLVAENRAVAKD